MLFDTEKLTDLMQEYKHTDVFYVKARPLVPLRGKSVDHSEMAQSTEMQSDKFDQHVQDGSPCLYTEHRNEQFMYYECTDFRFFSLYFYKIKVNYSGNIFTDCFLLERDSLSDNFFELYTKDLLLNQFTDYFVTHNEANRILIRNQAINSSTIIPTI